VEQRCEEKSSGGAGTGLPRGSTSHKSIKENEEPIKQGVSKDLKVGDVFLHKYGKT